MPSEASGDGFAISSRPVADHVVMVEIRGDLDIHTVPPIKTFLAQATATGPQHLILDLTGVEFLASSGLGLLIAVSYGDKSRAGCICSASPETGGSNDLWPRSRYSTCSTSPPTSTPFWPSSTASNPPPTPPHEQPSTT
jgi:anti-anti-sigma factor